MGGELSELGIIHDGGMLIHDGKIDIVASSTDIEKKADGAEIIDADGKIVLPGFVDAHTHLIFAGNR
ncbi:MAG: imidazolonepropionase, partial [Verrucomicrobia bacterium]